MVLLGLGVVFGYGGALASFRHHARGHECGSGWEANRGWGHGRWDERGGGFERSERAAQVAPIIVQAPAPVAAPAAAPVVTPQVFVIMPGATQAVPAAVIPSANVAPAAVAP